MDLIKDVEEEGKNAYLILTRMSSCPPGGSERAQRQLFRALRYHTLQDPQLHNTLKDLLASVSAPGKGLSTAARIYLARREFAVGEQKQPSPQVIMFACCFNLLGEF